MIILDERTGVYKLVIDLRREKTCRKICWFTLYLDLVPKEDDEDQHDAKEWKACPFGHLPHETTESYCGFLVYVSRTYGALVPYRKGIHLMIGSWCPLHNDDGWKNTSTLKA
jgi:hypothetical protein